jgi:hypothetical protein
MIFEMVVSQVHFESKHGLCPIRGGTLLDIHGERFLVKVDELRSVSSIELDCDVVKLVIKYPTKRIRKCIASNEPKFKAGRW